MSKYISLDNLARYDGKMQEYAESVCAEHNDAMWRQTEKAGAVAFWPVGNSPLEGIVEFMFKETGPASGTKSPSNPSTIAGVSSAKVTRCGKNVCSTKYLRETGTGGLYTFDAATGGIKISGTTDSRGGALEFRSVFDSSNALRGGMLQRGKTYTFSHTGNAPAGTYPYFRLYVQDTASSGWANRVQLSNGSSATYTIPSTAYACLVRIDLNYNTTYNCECFVQIEEGSVATPFEKYEGTDYTINLGNTYYGGSVDLATGVLTETVFHGVFDDPYGYIETLTDSTYVCIQQTKGSYPPHAANADVNISCNMFATTGAGEKIALRGNAGGGAVALFLLRSRLDLSNAANPSNPTSAEWVAAFQAWRQQQSQEIKFTYTRNTPLTVQLTAPQIRSLIQPDKYVPRINTVYSDAEAVQIAYQKNHVRDEFEKVQAILAQGGNI